MTKKEMIEEMSRGLKGIDINNRMKNKKARIEEIYKWYLTSEKTIVDKKMCMSLLTVW